jgi:hypothetical protein
LISKGKILLRKNKAGGQIIVKNALARDVLMPNPLKPGHFISRSGQSWAISFGRGGCSPFCTFFVDKIVRKNFDCRKVP